MEDIMDQRINSVTESEDGYVKLEIDMDEQTKRWLINYAIIDILKIGLDEVAQLHKEDIKVEFIDQLHSLLQHSVYIRLCLWNRYLSFLQGKKCMSALNTQEGGSHYKDMLIQPVEFIVKNDIAFLEANVIKYVCRHRNKNGIQDLNKAIHYLELAKELYYGDYDRNK